MLTRAGWPRWAWPTDCPRNSSGAVRAERSERVAKPDATRLRAAELEVSDLVCRDQDLASLVVREGEDRAVCNCGHQGGLYLLERGFGFHHEFPRHGLNPDLDFHGAPLAPGKKSSAEANPQPDLDRPSGGRRGYAASETSLSGKRPG